MNGLAIFEKTDKGTRGFYIDQETIEFAQMNARTKKRLAKADAEKQEADLKCRKAEKAAARRKAYMMDTVRYVLTRVGVSCAVALAGAAGFIHPVIFIPVSVICLCAACMRLGQWIGKVVK